MRVAAKSRRQLTFPAPFTQAACNGRFTAVGSVCVQEFRDALNAIVVARLEGAPEPTWFLAAMKECS